MRNEMCKMSSAGVGLVIQLASDDAGFDPREEDHVVVAKLHVQGPAHLSGLVRKSCHIVFHYDDTSHVPANAYASRLCGVDDIRDVG